MGRIMALDIGDKRIGIALSDILHITAQGHETYQRRDIEKDMEYIASLAEKKDVEEIVCGLPLNMNGSKGFQAEKVEGFCNELKNNLQIPIKFFDERLTTMQAERILISADLSREKRKKVIDKMAAVVILQGYLGN